MSLPGRHVRAGTGEFELEPQLLHGRKRNANHARSRSIESHPLALRNARCRHSVIHCSLSGSSGAPDGSSASPSTPPSRSSCALWQRATSRWPTPHPNVLHRRALGPGRPEIKSCVPPGSVYRGGTADCRTVDANMSHDPVGRPLRGAHHDGYLDKPVDRASAALRRSVFGRESAAP